MLRLTFFLSMMMLITACSSTKIKNDCSCATYQPKSPRPSWIDNENVSSKALLSSGGSQCTGIQTLDFKESDQNARLNLGLLIRANVRGETNIIKRQDSSVGGLSQASVQSTVSSESLLENAFVYDRWVDPINCSIHSAIRLNKEDYQRTKNRLQEIEARKPKNQLMLLRLKNNVPSELLLATLSNLGAQKLTLDQTISSQVYTIEWESQQPQEHVEGSIHAIIVKSILLVKNRKDQVVLSLVKNGKSFHRGNVNDPSFLYEKARRHALLQMHEPLKKFLTTSITQ